MLKRTFRPVTYRSWLLTGVTCVCSGFGAMIWLYVAGRWYPRCLFMVGALRLIHMASFTFFLCKLDSRVSTHVTPVRDQDL